MSHLIVTLVHGTWGRGFFPAKRPSVSGQRWFEADSAFRGRLEGLLRRSGDELAVEVVPWSGSNSIFERDRTSAGVVELLRAQAAAHPQARRVVIGHSHGGNVALKAATEVATADQPVDVVTLATPFLRVAEREPGLQFVVVFILAMLLLVGPFLAMMAWLHARYGAWAAAPVVLLVAVVFSAGPWWWDQFWRRRREALLASNCRPLRHGRVLVVRGFVDEASLGLALGAAGSELIHQLLALPRIPWRLAGGLFRLPLRLLGACVGRCLPKRITFVQLARLVGLFYVLAALAVLFWAIALLPPIETLVEGSRAAWWVWVVLPLAMVAALALGGLCLAVHGRELFWHCLKLIVTTDSAPDARGGVDIVTLKITHDSGSGLRHGIYNDRDCAVGGWLDSRWHHPVARRGL